MRKTIRWLEPLLLPALLLLAWEGLAYLDVLPRYLSAPWAIARAAWVTRDDLGASTLVSLWRAYAGFVLGAIAGALCGLAAALRPSVRNILDPLVAFLYPVPKIAFLPVVLLLFGFGDTSKIVIIAGSVFFPLFLATRRAVLSIDRNLILVGRSMGGSPRYVFWRVIIPAVCPQIFAGARVGLAMSFIILFAAEIIGARAGLGYLVGEAENGLQFDVMLSAIAGFAILGFVSDRILMTVRARVLHGQMIGTEERSPA